MADVNITFETLYEMLRNEKNREDIQELPAAYYREIVTFLKKNQSRLAEAVSEGQEEESEDLMRQIKNIKSLIKEIYERREKKIINLALASSRSSSESMELESLLPEELEFYKRIQGILNEFRANNLMKTIQGSAPNVSVNRAAQVSPASSSPPKTETKTQEDHKSTVDSKPEQKPSTISEQSKSPGMLTLKFKDNVPKFLGKELEVYGPFDTNDVAELPDDLASVLIRKGKAEVVQE